MLVNAHGGNAGPLRRRGRARSATEGRDVRAWHARFGGDAHAGRTETSLMLALEPDRGAARSAPRPATRRRWPS